jgi:hypothetical protein
MTTSSWYFGSWDSIYFDILRWDSKLDRFNLIVKPDLSDTSLHVINTFELTPHNFDYVSLQSYRICEDTLVCFWSNSGNNKCGIFTGLTFAHFSDDVSVRHWCDHSLCPASGRLVCFVYSGDDYGRIVVVDLI